MVSEAACKSNVYDLKTYRDLSKKKTVAKEIHYTLGGIPKKTHSNKVTGKFSEVYPFKSKEEINAIVNVLDGKINSAVTDTELWIAHRNKLLFVFGINVGIRASDLTTLKWNFFFDDDGNRRDYYELIPKKQSKSHKKVKLFFNESIVSAINDYISLFPIDSFNDYVFMSRNHQHLTTAQMWNIIKGAAIEAGIKQNIGTHSLRKTWGYHCWHNAEDKEKALVILQKCFGHSSSETTLRYIGILDEEIEEMYNSIALGL